MSEKPKQDPKPRPVCLVPRGADEDGIAVLEITASLNRHCEVVAFDLRSVQGASMADTAMAAYLMSQMAAKAR